MDTLFGCLSFQYLYRALFFDTQEKPKFFKIIEERRYRSSLMYIIADVLDENNEDEFRKSKIE